MLFGWRQMVTNGRRDLKDIGRYRRHEDPMQIVSGPIHAPAVHFEAPPSDAVPEEMARFVDWFNRTAPGGAEPMPALTRSGVTHLWFECIHPFEDGNGRIGRALAEKALAQGLGGPRSRLSRRRSSPGARATMRLSSATTPDSRSRTGSSGSPRPRSRRNGGRSPSSTS